MRIGFARRALAQLLFLGLSIIATQAGAADRATALRQAQEAFGRSDYADAISILEKSLPDASGDERLLELLRRCYRAEFKSRMAANDQVTADKLLARLRLIEQVPQGQAGSPIRPADSNSASVPPVNRPNPATRHANAVPDNDGSPAGSPHRTTADADDWVPVKSAAAPATKSKSPSSPDQGDSASHKADSNRSNVRVVGVHPPDGKQPSATARDATTTKQVAPSASPPAVASSKGTARPTGTVSGMLAQADALFVAQQYLDAGMAYSQVRNSEANSLTRTQQDRWNYCRLVALVQRINDAPSSAEDWTVIKAEAQDVLNQLPDSEFGKSLLRFAESRSAQPGSIRMDPDTIVRASSPDPSTDSSKTLLAGLVTRMGLSKSVDSSKRSLWKKSRSGNWQVLETANFRIHYVDNQGEEMAGPAADIAECTRMELHRTWFGSAPKDDWQPKCDIYIHPTSDSYVRATKQGPQSPGHSSTGVDRGRVVSRRVDLRRDGPDLIDAVLPHEITHVVMTDRFPQKPLARWADEGLAVLTEPTEKKVAHLRNLSDMSKRNRLFDSKQLMTMTDYPAGNLWGMFYAQSVSLVEFLVDRGGPEKFIEFLSRSNQNGYEAELKRIYQIDGFSGLDKAWSQGRVEQLAAAR